MYERRSRASRICVTKPELGHEIQRNDAEINVGGGLIPEIRLGHEIPTWQPDRAAELCDIHFISTVSNQSYGHSDCNSNFRN